MATNYAKQFNRKVTPQSRAIPGSGQTENNAGGYAWEVDCWTQLDRFLILGAESCTYYASQEKLIDVNHDGVLKCIAEDALRAVNRIIEISDSGRAPKNDPAIFALALVATHGDLAAKRAVRLNLNKVCRIGTHLFHFAEYINALRGWGRSVRTAVANWYTRQDADRLALQAVKYQQRDGWSHRDLLRLSHPTPGSNEHNAVFRFMCGKTDQELESFYPRAIEGYQKIQLAQSAPEVVRLIAEYQLPREVVPTQFLNDERTWEALLDHMPMTAMIRNLGKMTNIGLIKPLSTASRIVVDQLSNKDAVKRARVHPLTILTALKVYQQGHGIKGNLSWNPVPMINQALSNAFYAAFDNVVPSGKPTLLALDVSSSMTWGTIAGSPLCPREASACMAMVTARTEPNYHILGFSHRLVDIPINPTMGLNDIIRVIERVPMAGTDCALPMKWAISEKAPVEGFVVYTDNETWYGDIHPAQALKQHRSQLGVNSKLVVVGMTADKFSIADPKDPGMMDVVGFDSAAPALISDFIRE